MKKVIYKATLICIISATLGITYNMIFNPGIHLLSRQPKSSYPEVSLEEVKVKLEEKGVIFIDARTKEEFAKGHINGAINMPYNNFEIAYHQATPFHNAIEKEIIVYCGGGDCPSSLLVAENLTLLGHTNVKVFLGGWASWVKNQIKEKG
ncbi:MAG: rhodanese-like domain-containing protein [Nitrospirota bacterium]